jgi:hypothetical protein
LSAKSVLLKRERAWLLDSYLMDPEEASWVIGDNDEVVPSAVFPTAEAAFRAWERAEEVTQHGRSVGRRR